MVELMNNEQLLNRNQMQEAAGLVDEAVDIALGNAAAEYYNPNSQSLPHPNYIRSLYDTYGDMGGDLLGGAEFDPTEFEDLRQSCWHNMRAAVALLSSDNRVMWFPATILPDARVAYLSEDMIQNPASHGNLSEIQHMALNNVYLTETSSADHSGTANAAESKHGLILASSAKPTGIHNAVHTMDRGGSFVTKAGSGAIHDIGVGDSIRRVRPVVIPLRRAASLVIRPEFQPPQEPAFGLEISDQQLLIASTLAAAHSRKQAVGLERNITAMVEEAVN